MLALSAALTMLTGCAEAPTYQGISAVTVIRQTAQGTSRKELTGDDLDAVAQCLYSTQPVAQPEELTDLLGSIIILEVKDNMSDRMFELYSQQYMKGNKGNYYQNGCIYALTQQL